MGALVLFVIFQLIGAVLQAHGVIGVSYLGHLGGLLVGIAAGAVALACRSGSLRATLKDDGEGARDADGYVRRP